MLPQVSNMQKTCKIRETNNTTSSGNKISKGAVKGYKTATSKHAK